MRNSITILEVANGFYVRTGDYDHGGPVDDKTVFVFTNTADLALWVSRHFGKPDPLPQAPLPYPPMAPQVPEAE